MIELNPDSVQSIINMAREFQTQASMHAGDVPVGPMDDRNFEQLEEWHGDPAYIELKGAIDDLEPDQQATLVALMWLGRGDYDLESWDEALSYATEVHGPNTPDYLIASPLLADYLEQGLEQHGYEND